MATVVQAGPQDTNDQLIKKFKKKVLQEDILNKLKEKEFFKKPSLLKKEKLAEFRKRRKRRLQAKKG
ncbi:MAG: 30S ribosomal protein S21 [Patescibacteria group bacterium]|jgi:ribosomal protein S21